MILTAHQPVYLPWLGLLHKIACANQFVWFDDVQYQDRDWNNRNMVKTASGPLWLTVPVKSKNHFEIKLRDAQIQNESPWRRKHLKTIQSAYAKARYYKRYIGFFEHLYAQEWTFLAWLNEFILRWLLAEFGIKVQFDRLSELGVAGKKSDLVLNMCLKLNADVYTFGAQGRNYCDEVAFGEAGVRVRYQDYQHPVYRQLHDNFIPNMSAIDLLFNHGPASYNIMMSGNFKKEDLQWKSTKPPRPSNSGITSSTSTV